MVQRNKQVPYHLQSILANQSARISTRLIIPVWIFQSEAQTPFQAHIRITTPSTASYFRGKSHEITAHSSADRIAHRQQRCHTCHPNREDIGQVQVCADEALEKCSFCPEPASSRPGPEPTLLFSIEKEGSQKEVINQLARKLHLTLRTPSNFSNPVTFKSCQGHLLNWNRQHTRITRT